MALIPVKDLLRMLFLFFRIDYPSFRGLLLLFRDCSSVWTGTGLIITFEFLLQFSPVLSSLDPLITYFLLGLNYMLVLKPFSRFFIPLSFWTLACYFYCYFLFYSDFASLAYLLAFLDLALFAIKELSRESQIALKEEFNYSSLLFCFGDSWETYYYSFYSVGGALPRIFSILWVF